MLYDSTKTLLQSILRTLESGDESRWDDQIESGNACLYEMHQMAAPMYKAYRTDSLNANSVAQNSLPEKLYRAMPHVRSMVIAIRHRDRTKALESGKTALAEMNGGVSFRAAVTATERNTVNHTPASVSRQKGKPGERHRPAVQDRPSGRVKAAGGK